MLILCLALISPIDPLGDAYLFSAHMLQHLLLILIVPPLLILGLAPQRAAGWMSHPRTRQAESVLGRPVVAWSCNMLMMVIWHLPALYNAGECEHGDPHRRASHFSGDWLHVLVANRYAAQRGAHATRPGDALPVRRCRCQHATGHRNYFLAGRPLPPVSASGRRTGRAASDS